MELWEDGQRVPPDIMDEIPFNPPSIPTIDGKAVGMVGDRFAQAQAYAASAYDAANDLVKNLGTASSDPDNFDVDDFIVDPVGDLDSTPPGPPPLSANPPRDPGAPDPPGTSPGFSSVRLNIPPFTVKDPGYDPPRKPEVDWPPFNERSPTLTPVNPPGRLDVDIPDVPRFEDIVVPPPPIYSMPRFDAKHPIYDLTPPENMFVWHETPYDSALLQKLSFEIHNELENGSTGLTPEVEQAIWDRALSRLRYEDEKAFDDAANYFASRGWQLPVGALNSSILEVRRNIANRNLDLSRDIMVQSSDLAQKNRHFMFAQGMALEQLLMERTNQIAARAFEASKFSSQYALEVYNARVSAYAARMEAHKTLAQVYETKIRAEIAKAEMYKAEIEGAKLSVEVQKNRIDIYKAQLSGIEILAQIYRTEMEGAKVESEINKIKVDTFKAQVDAYVAQIGVNTTRYQAYQAEIAGEAAKVDMYKTHVQAWVSRVDAEKAKSEIQLNGFTKDIEDKRLLLDEYRAEVEAYSTEMQQLIAKSATEVELDKSRVAMFDSEIRMYEAEMDAKIKEYVANVQHASNLAQASVSVATSNANRIGAHLETLKNNTRAAAQVAGQLAAAAMNSVSATASVGYSEQESLSGSTSISYQKSRSDSQSKQNSISYSNVDSRTQSQSNSSATGTYHNYNYSS